jgi:hypothetical protein
LTTLALFGLGLALAGWMRKMDEISIASAAELRTIVRIGAYPKDRATVNTKDSQFAING